MIQSHLAPDPILLYHPSKWTTVAVFQGQDRALREEHQDQIQKGQGVQKGRFIAMEISI